MSPSYNIHDLLKKPETQLGKLIAQAQAIGELSCTFTKVLDPDLISHCRVGCYESGVLTLFTESAAWATKLRYSVPTILSKLRTFPQWAGLCSIQVKVQTSWHQMVAPPPPKVNNIMPKLSAINTIQLQALADTLKGQPGTEKLVESLERLAKHQG